MHGPHARETPDYKSSEIGPAGDFASIPVAKHKSAQHKEKIDE